LGSILYAAFLSPIEPCDAAAAAAVVNAGLSFKTGVIFWASTLQTFGRSILILTMSILARLSCNDQIAWRWSESLAVVHYLLSEVKEAQIRFGNVRGFPCAIVQLLVDSLMGFSTWWLVLSRHELELEWQFVWLGWSAVLLCYYNLACVLTVFAMQTYFGNRILERVYHRISEFRARNSVKKQS
jgi:hypothetical protein